MPDDRSVALVTGASKGIGQAVAIALARDGFDIWLNYRQDHASAEKVKQSIIEYDVHCELIPFDVSNSQETQNALSSRLEKTTPYVLVNNAGFTRDSLLMWMEYTDWHDVLAVHLDGFFNLTKLIIFHMLRAKKGRVINIASASGQSGVPGQTAYSAANAGLIGATKALALEVAKRGILVNAVAPGYINTDIIKNLDQEKILQRIPLRRMGDPQEVAEVVSFLASFKASYITGQVIAVNGGIYT